VRHYKDLVTTLTVSKMHAMHFKNNNSNHIVIIITIIIIIF